MCSAYDSQFLGPAILLLGTTASPHPLESSNAVASPQPSAPHASPESPETLQPHVLPLKAQIPT